jgi:hypothetical protein
MLKVKSQLTFVDGHSARGRNGEFVPKHMFFRKVGTFITLGIMSKRKVFPPPIYLTMKVSDAKRMAKALRHVCRCETDVQIGIIPKGRHDDTRDRQRWEAHARKV